MSRRTQCLLVSDFNLETFKAHFEHHEEGPDVEAITAPFGQVIPVLKGAGLKQCGPLPQYSVVWTLPERVIASFKLVLNHRPVSIDEILAEVDAYSRLVIEFRQYVRNILVPAWVMPPNSSGQGMLSMVNGSGTANILMRMNLRLSENFDDTPDIRLLDAQRWITRAGPNAFSPKLWYLGKVPFGNEVFQAAAADIKSALRGLSGQARKLIVLDLDDTLWGGTVGEVGWQGLNLGGHNALGEAYADFQHALKALTRRGVILGIASKNTESIALEVFKRHPEMVLDLEDFADWRINWQDKAQNILNLVASLGLGLNSTVFIDDNAAERARVRDALPDIAVPEWPKNAMLYKSALLDLPYFDFPNVSREDLARSQMYTAERQRKALRNEIESVEDWLKNLNMKIKVEELTDANLQRTVQLLNKTNQFNLSTRRLSETELLDWLEDDDRKLWTFRVADKFGDSGLCGVLSVQMERTDCRIVDFVLSCRVIGRKVEETMLHTAISHTRLAGFRKLYADYIPTARNEPCRIFLERTGLKHDPETNRFTWNTSRPYPLPAEVKIEAPGARIHA